jgi:hypothetical protein
MNYVEKITEIRTNKQLYMKAWLVISLTVSIAGLVIITNSVGWGDDAANAAVGAHGGLDTATYLVILQESISSYRTMGALLLLIGGAGCLMSIKFLEERKNIGDDL